MMQTLWTSDRPTATILSVRAEADSATAALDVGGAKVDLALVKEDGEWRVTFLASGR